MNGNVFGVLFRTKTHVSESKVGAALEEDFVLSSSFRGGKKKTVKNLRHVKSDNV